MLSTIRVAGPYTIGTDGVSIYCNGRIARIRDAAPGAKNNNGVAVTHVVATGKRGANGKPDVVGLTAIEAEVHFQRVQARLAADRAAFEASPEVAARRARQQSERAYDLGMNEGGEGYNPHRYGSAHTYGRKSATDRYSSEVE